MWVPLHKRNILVSTSGTKQMGQNTAYSTTTTTKESKQDHHSRLKAVSRCQRRWVYIITYSVFTFFHQLKSDSELLTTGVIVEKRESVCETVISRAFFVNGYESFCKNWYFGMWCLLSVDSLFLLLPAAQLFWHQSGCQWWVLQKELFHHLMLSATSNTVLLLQDWLKAKVHFPARPYDSVFSAAHNCGSVVV